MMRYALTLALSLMAALALAGCAGMLSSAPPPEDWPKLQIVVISAPADEMLAACARVGVSSPGPACALINFDRKRCSIIFRDDRPMAQEVYDHEEQHCLGKDDFGRDDLRRAWEKWKKTQ